MKVIPENMLEFKPWVILLLVDAQVLTDVSWQNRHTQSRCCWQLHMWLIDQSQLLQSIGCLMNSSLLDSRPQLLSRPFGSRAQITLLFCQKSWWTVNDQLPSYGFSTCLKLTSSSIHWYLSPRWGYASPSRKFRMTYQKPGRPWWNMSRKNLFACWALAPDMIIKQGLTPPWMVL